MKKSGKILFVSILMIMFIFAFSNIVKAADEIEYTGSTDDGYEELGTGSEDESNKQPTQEPAKPTEEQKPAQEPEKQEEQQPTQESAKQTEEKTPTTSTVEPTNKANTSTEAHATAGEFKTTLCVVGAGVFGITLIAGYVKFKKYNF